MKRKKATKEELIKAMNEEMAHNIELSRPILENNLLKFNKSVLQVEKGKGNVPLAPVHEELCSFIDKNKKKKKLVLIPRGHLKSTVVTVGRVLQKIASDPSSRILIANATHNLACSFLTEVKRHLKFNDKFKMFWGDLAKDAPIWSQNQITLSSSRRKEPTVTAMGVESNMTSQHYDMIIMDDLVNAEYVNTQDQIQKTINFYKETLNLLEPNGEVIIIGTRWHDSDLYGWIMDRDNNVISDFETFIRKSYEGSLSTDEEFKALFPKKFSRKHLKKLYEQQGPYIFSCQYQNDPIPAEDADFRRDWFKYYDPTELKGRLMNKFVMIDPAISTEKDADYTAIVTVGVDEHKLIYILDVVRKRMKPSDIFDEVFKIWANYKPVVIGIEDVAFQKSLQYSLSEEMHKRNIYLPLKPLRPAGRNKDQRIRGLQPLYANGRVLHGKHLTQIRNLEDELLRFPRGKHDDIIDAMGYMLDIPIFPPKRKVTRQGKHKYLYASA
jgi:predicted phage terminase large subunit-like protein